MNFRVAGTLLVVPVVMVPDQRVHRMVDASYHVLPPTSGHRLN